MSPSTVLQPATLPRPTSLPTSVRPSSSWQLQDAKAQFSALVKQAQTAGPQHISVHGKPAAVVLSQADYRRLQTRASKPGFVELMQGSPLMGLDMVLQRSSSVTRDVSLEI
jgi:prevent-host-death family protein